MVRDRLRDEQRPARRGAAAAGRRSRAGRPAAAPLARLVLALDGLVEAGLLSPRRRRGAEWPCWSAVHGFALLALGGPLRGQPPRSCGARRSGRSTRSSRASWPEGRLPVGGGGHGGGMTDEQTTTPETTPETTTDAGTTGTTAGTPTDGGDRREGETLGRHPRRADLRPGPRARPERVVSGDDPITEAQKSYPRQPRPPGRRGAPRRHVEGGGVPAHRPAQDPARHRLSGPAGEPLSPATARAGAAGRRARSTSSSSKRTCGSSRESPKSSRSCATR